MPLEQTIDLLRAVAASPDCAKMNLSTIKGYLGELLIKQRLEAELNSIAVEHLGNQHGHDLQYTYAGKPVKIDVKTSTAKDGRFWGFQYWSWSLLNDTKKKGISATHFVCAGLDEHLALHAVFVVNAKDLAHFPRDTGQFRNNKHVLFLSQSEPPFGARGATEALYLQSRELLRLGHVRQVADHGNLVQACA